MIVHATDYDPNSIPDTVTIAATAERECFNGMVINDVLALEEDEQFRLTLFDPTPSGVIIGQGTAIITIRDDNGRRDQSVLAFSDSTVVSSSLYPLQLWW